MQRHTIGLQLHQRNQIITTKTHHSADSAICLQTIIGERDWSVAAVYLGRVDFKDDWKWKVWLNVKYGYISVTWSNFRMSVKPNHV